MSFKYVYFLAINKTYKLTERLKVAALHFSRYRLCNKTDRNIALGTTSTKSNSKLIDICNKDITKYLTVLTKTEDYTYLRIILQLSPFLRSQSSLFPSIKIFFSDVP